ncbi:26128_t:CDS:1, partial [Gigaspora rosea]
PLILEEAIKKEIENKEKEIKNTKKGFVNMMKEMKKKGFVNMMKEMKEMKEEEIIKIQLEGEEITILDLSKKLPKGNETTKCFLPLPKLFEIKIEVTYSVFDIVRILIETNRTNSNFQKLANLHSIEIC